METIYRDDDASVDTCPHLFKELHEKFFKDRTHTVAVLMKDLWNNHALFYYLLIAKNLSVELHGWEHLDYSTMTYEECLRDLKLSLDYWNTNATRMLKRELQADKQITTFFAPWNRESDNIKKACNDLGLKFCAVKEGEWQGYNIKSFHWWSTMNNDFTI